jgi:hypothetical protein
MLAHLYRGEKLIGSEAVEEYRRGNVLSKRAGTIGWPRVARDAQDSQGLNMSLEERVRRKLILPPPVINRKTGAGGEVH